MYEQPQVRRCLPCLVINALLLCSKDERLNITQEVRQTYTFYREFPFIFALNIKNF